MALIDEIITKIEAIPIGGNGDLVLKSSDFGLDFMSSFFNKLILSEGITLTDASKTPGTETITVAGTADLYGYTSLGLSLTFDVQDNEVVGTVTGTFAKAKKVTLPLITWIEVESIVLSTGITETFNLISLDFKMDILVQGSSATIPIELRRQSDSEWRLDIAEGAEQGVTGTELVGLLGGETLESFVPEPLSKILAGFKINGIEAIFDTNLKTVSYFTAGLSVTNGWDIAPKVSLKPGLQVNLTLINPTDKDTRVVAGSLTATFELGGVLVPIMIGATVGSTSLWTFGLQPEQKVTLPSFSNLLELAGGKDFLDSLPAGLSKIPQIEINTLQIDFEPDNKQLTLLSFSMQTVSTWQIIEGYFAIQKLKVAFDITNLTDPPNRLILGDVEAIFLVDKVALMCGIKKTKENPDWTIIAGLAPGTTLNLTQVAKGLFEGKITLPDKVPDFAFSVLQITVVPDKKSFEFQAHSANEWPIIEKKLSIKEFDLDFKRDPSNNNPITGHIKTTLEIVDVTLNLKASLNETPDGGWQFSGDIGTSSIPIGKLIDELAGIFGGGITLPPALTGFSIEKLGVTFNTSNKDFTFTCTLKDTEFPSLDLVLEIKLLHKDGSYTNTFSGTAHYKSEKFVMDFQVIFEETVTQKPPSKTSTFTATYDAKTPPKLSDCLEAISQDLGFDADLPAELNFDAELKSLILEWIKKDNDPPKLEAAGLFQLSIDSSDWDFYLSYSNACYFENLGANSRALGPDGKPAYVFGISFSGILDLEKLPLVGNIPGVGDYNIDKLGFYYTDAAFTADDKKLIFGVAELVSPTKLAPDPAAAFLSQPKFNLMALLGKKNDSSSSSPNALPLPTGTGNGNGKALALTNDPPKFAKDQANPEKPIVWLPVNKTLGPVDLVKVGLGYEKPGKDDTGELGIVGIYVTGAFTLAGLSMVLDRLGITFPVPKPGGSIENPLSKVGFHLGGMFLEYKEPGLEIAGGFITLPGNGVNMIGEFIVQAGQYGLQGYGGYADNIGHPSLFIFLHLKAPLGGPPFFFITGISGGFGINRGFKLPTYEQLPTYPLLPASDAIPTAGSLGGKTNEEKLALMTQSLLSLSDYFPVQNGEYWFAVGLDVTSFQMIEVSVILSIAFGVELQIAVIGSASMTLPVKEPAPIAYIQINFMVSYSSSSGLLAVMGAITPASFIYAGLVHISGGFAFYTWFSGPHSGDFVLTVGGYNSHYKRPDFYPDVPRMELRAGIDIVNMVGQAYFALLPHMIMAGLDIKATADLGPISAWFDAGVDFIIGWKPFHYEAEAHIEIGASFTIDVGFVKIKITIHVGVALNIWGPEFGGKARVDLDIISFTINFGAAPQPAPLLEWNAFQEFLPSVPAPAPPKAAGRQAALVAEGTDTGTEKPFVNILIQGGLVKAFPEGQEVDGLNWIVDPNHFDLRTHSIAPCTQVVYNGATLPDDYKFFDPANLREEINSAQHDGQEPPYYVYKTPDGETPWNKLAFGIPPMGLINIKSIHTVTIQKLPLSKPTNIDDIIITLCTDGVPPSLWGNEPVTNGSVNSDKTVIKNALVELQFTPMLWFPKRTTYIPYYYLVFNTNNLFLEQAAAPTINSSTFPDPEAIYEAMQLGTAFISTDEVRTKIAATLTGLGFDYLDLENSGKLSTQDYVADPMLTYMSSTNETNFGS
jgi:hypothetical protein